MPVDLIKSSTTVARLLVLYLLFSCEFSPVQAENIHTHLASLQEESDQVNQKIEVAQAKIRHARIELRQIKDRVDTLQHKQAQLEQELDQIEQGLATVMLELVEIKLSIMELEQRRLTRIQAVEQVDQPLLVSELFLDHSQAHDLDDLSRLLASFHQQDSELVSSANQLVVQLAKTQREELKLKATKEELYQEIRAKRDLLSEELRRKQAAERSVVKQEQQLKAEMIALQAQALRLEAVLAGLKSEEHQAAGFEFKNKRRRVLLELEDDTRPPPFKKSGVALPIVGAEVVPSHKIVAGPQKNGLVFKWSDTKQDRKGGEVVAVLSGKVSFIGTLPFFGSTVIIEHAQDEFSLYGGLKESTVNLADSVPAGGQIGAISAGGELYFELRSKGKTVNPAPLFRISAS